MDRFEEMQLTIASESFGLPEVVATGVAIAAAGAIYGTVSLADKIISKIASKAKQAYDNNPKVQKRRHEKEERRKALRDERAQKALMNRVIDGTPYPEWKQGMEAIRDKYGPIILKLHKEYTDAIERDLKKLTSNGKYKGFPTCFFAFPSNYEAIMYTFDPDYPLLALSFFEVGTYFPEYNLENWEWSDHEYDEGLMAHEDSDVRAIATKASVLVSAYLKENNRIIEKHMNAFVSALKSAGVPAKEWEPEHMSDEFALESICVYLRDPDIKKGE